jgi:Domain of unknown function(DUF2779)
LSLCIYTFVYMINELTLNQLYRQLEKLKLEKQQLINTQQFEATADLRNTEKNIEKQINITLMKKDFMLSKSRYVRGTNCMKSLWMYVHKTVQIEVSEAQEAIFQTGHDVGALAQNYFPNGVLAVQAHEYPNKKTADYTRQLVEKGATTIYEATFVYDNIVVAVDVLHRIANTWYFFEVKSSTCVKDYHYIDAAVQYYVLKNSLMAWKFHQEKKLEANIMYLNSEYVRHGDLDVKDLFSHENITEVVQDIQADIAPNTRDLRIMLNAEMPMVAMGKQCTKPFTCEFYDHCYVAENKNVSDEPSTNDTNNEPKVNVKAITDFVSAIEYPIGFFDFETIMPAVPEWDNSRPYQQLAFQYSLHLQQDADAVLIAHKECLADSKQDPRLCIMQKMIADTANAKTLFVYNISFEKTRIKEMIRDFPKYENALNAMLEKLVDLMPIFRYHYRTASMEKRYSIKVVLPALFPELDYKDLEIGDGMTASNRFYNLYKSNFSETDIENIRKDLIAYCERDTWAMVKLWEKIKTIG